MILVTSENERLKNEISMLNEKIKYLEVKYEDVPDITHQ